VAGYAELIVDLDEATVEIDAVEPEVRGQRLAADRDEQSVATNVLAVSP
jgi:hypothetical protein